MPLQHNERPPRVSLGLPVYNGENYVGEAIASILHQTFPDFELIICDNASNDGTEAICREYARQDPRVHYHRNATNLGAGPNFNCTLELARGEYFRWAAHDDLLEPTYLERCVEVLDRHLDVVLCHTLTRVIGDRGEGLARELKGLDAASPAARFGAVVLRPHWCLEIFGLTRTAALRRTGLYRPYFGTDKAVLAELALQGRFHRIQEPLFISRDHPQRSLRALAYHQRQTFQDATGTCPPLPSWALYKDHLHAIRRLVTDDRAERLRCYQQLVKWWFANWHAVRVGLDLVCMIDPHVSIMAHRLRNWYHRGAFGVR